VVAVGAAGGAADQGAVPQAVPVDADKGSTGGWSGPQLGTAPTVRDAGGDADRGSGR
jgi:hypothetical protein